MSLTTTYHFMINIPDEFWLQEIELLEVFIFRYAGLYMTMYFVFKKASKPLKNKKKWINYGIIPAILVSLMCITVLVIYLEVQFSRLASSISKEERS